MRYLWKPIGWSALFRIQILADSTKTRTMATICEETKEKAASSQAVSFTVDFDEPKKKPRRLPKNLSAERLQRRQELSHERLAEKQRLAEERRKVN